MGGSGGATYAIGDVHGRADLLAEALARIDRDAQGREPRIICLGDMVDRGPQSREAVSLLKRRAERCGLEVLRGNHEVMMLNAFSEGAARRDHWKRSGGVATLASYLPPNTGSAGMTLLREHLAWIDQLPLVLRDAHRTYVHAGLKPFCTAEPDEATCLWIREPFLTAGAKGFTSHVVHGHTPTWAGKPHAGLPELLGHRTNLDTAAYLTGVLTVGVFDPDVAGGPRELWAVTV